jgi:molybdate transport system substrate-binding protein
MAGRQVDSPLRRAAWPYCVGFLGIALLCGCSGTATTGRADNGAARVTIFAAASTTEALSAAIDEYRAQHPNQRIVASFGASSILAQQIAAGAAADLFLSADEDWARYLAERKLVARSQILLSNSLVVVVPQDSKIELSSLGDLAKPQVGRVAMADPEHVPAGKYARQALEKLGIWETVRGKMVSGNDVRFALAYVEEGAADAGIVYATDARASKKVRVALAIDPALAGQVRYPIALLKTQGAATDEARAFYDWLCSAEAAAIFRGYGFSAGEVLNVANVELSP